MSKPTLSIVMPGVRPHNWKKCFDSIRPSTSGSFEFIIVSPYALPAELREDFPYIKYIKDYGSSVRCFELGASVAEGKYITAFADDAVYAAGALDTLISKLDAMGPNINNVISAKYTEAGDHFNEDYFKINKVSWTSSPHVSDEWYIINSFIYHTEYYQQMGGMDMDFESIPLALTDLAIRTYRDGATIQFCHVELLYADHEEALGGTHAPIYYAFIENDADLYKKIHNDPLSINRVRLPNNNWKNAPTVWERRFGKL